MALSKAKRDEIPKDAVILNEQDAIEHQFNVMAEWEKKDDTWVWRFGPGFLGALSGLTGLLINNHYRTRLRLGTNGQISTYIPIVILPSIVSIVFHRTFIQPRILIQKDKCYACLQTRAILIQSVFGIAYPAVLAPLASYMMAVRHYTYRIPSVTENPKGVFMLYRKMTAPITMGLAIGFCVHAALASYLTYKETDSFFKVQNQLRKYELEFEEMVEQIKFKETLK